MTGRTRCPLCSLYHRNGHAARCVQVDRMWPLGPLAEAICRPGESVAVTLGVDTTALNRAAEFGLSDLLADRWAIRAGHHPAEIWPDWIDAGLTVTDRLFLEGGWRQAWLAAEPAEPSPLPVRNENAA